MFKYDEEKRLGTNNLTFLVCITFLYQRDQVKKKMFLLPCLYEIM